MAAHLTRRSKASFSHQSSWALAILWTQALSHSVILSRCNSLTLCSSPFSRPLSRGHTTETCIRALKTAQPFLVLHTQTEKIFASLSLSAYKETSLSQFCISDIFMQLRNLSALLPHPLIWFYPLVSECWSLCICPMLVVVDSVVVHFCHCGSSMWSDDRVVVEGGGQWLITWITMPMFWPWATPPWIELPQ